MAQLNNADYEYHSLFFGKSLLFELFGLELDDPTYIQFSMTALRLLGQMNTETYFYRGSIKDNVLQLPCNVGFLEAVSQDVIYIDGQMYNEQVLNGPNWYVPFLIADQVSGFPIYRKNAGVNLYVHGEYINYNFTRDNEGNPILKFDDLYIDAVNPTIGQDLWNDRRINVIYRGYISDNDGLIKIKEKEAEYIAYYINYIILQREFFRNAQRDQSLGERYQLATQLKDQKLKQAKSPTHLTQNQANDILNALTARHVHYYGTSMKYNI
jgi:hypothetical protein